MSNVMYIRVRLQYNCICIYVYLYTCIYVQYTIYKCPEYVNVRSRTSLQGWRPSLFPNALQCDHYDGDYTGDDYHDYTGDDYHDHTGDDYHDYTDDDDADNDHDYYDGDGFYDCNSLFQKLIVLD